MFGELGNWFSNLFADGVGTQAGKAVTPAITDAVAPTAVNAATDGLTTPLTNTLGAPLQTGVVPATLTGTDVVLPTGGLTNLTGVGTQVPQATLTPDVHGFWKDGLGADLKDALGSEQFKNATALGVGGWNALNQGKAYNNAYDIQKKQLAQSQDAYNRDKQASQNRQKLVF